jgi:hypothetical protein
MAIAVELDRSSSRSNGAREIVLALAPERFMVRDADAL